MRNLEYYRDWLNHDGRSVMIDGHKHMIKVRTHKAIYPYEYTAINVELYMINKKSDIYIKTKLKLGDDWFTDVLDSDPEFQAKILEQLNATT